MADLRPVTESQVSHPAPPNAVQWHRRAILHFHAEALARRGIAPDDAQSSMYPWAAEHTLASGASAATPVAPQASKHALPAGGLRSPAALGRSDGRRGSSGLPEAPATVTVDQSVVSAAVAYRIDPNDELAVGKYVPGAELLPPKGHAVASGKAKEGETAGAAMASAGSAAKAAAIAKAYGATSGSARARRGSASAVLGASASASRLPRRPASNRTGKPANAKVRVLPRAGTSAAAPDDSDDVAVAGDDDVADDIDNDDDGAAVPVAKARGGARRHKSSEVFDVACIESIFAGVPGNPSAATVLFPIAYPPPSKKKDAHSRGTPQLINNVVHAPWPAGAPYGTDASVLAKTPLRPPPGACLTTVASWDDRARFSPLAATATSSTGVPVPRLSVLRLQRDNTNVIPLYRVGPGAVAFRVVTSAFEAGGLQYTPGGVFDYHVARLVEHGGDVAHHVGDGEATRPQTGSDPNAFTVPDEYANGRTPSVGWHVPNPESSSTAASFNVLWAKRADQSVHGHMSPYQRVNHFPGSWGIGRKDNLHKNVSRLRLLTSAADFDIVPRTFLCPAEMMLLEQDAADYSKKHGGAEPTYIVKPVASSCGKGIRVVKGVPQSLRPSKPALTAAGQAVGESSAAGKSFIVQHYVDPFLVDGRKFDLRMYVAVTGVDPLRIFLFDQGLVRFAAERYPGADSLLDNTWAHLTNYAVNKTAQLRKESSGLDAEETDEPVDIKWMISDLRDHFLHTTRDTIPQPTPADRKRADELSGGRPTLKDVRSAQWSRVMQACKDVIVKTMLTVEADIRTQVRRQCRDGTGRGCFELFGFDLMLDSALRPHVIEVNIMPSLATAESVDKAVKGRMLAHLTTLLGVVPFDRAAERRERGDPLMGEHAAMYPADGPTATVKYTQKFLAAEGVRHAKRVREAAAASAASGDKKKRPMSDGAAAVKEDDDDDVEGLEGYQSASDAAVDEMLLDKSGGSDDDTTAQNASEGVKGAAPRPSPPAKPAQETRASPVRRLGSQTNEGPYVVQRRARNKPLMRLAAPSVLAALEASSGAPLEHKVLLGGGSGGKGDAELWGAHLSIAEARMVVEAEEELNRAGGFERIYPTPSSHRRYSHLFGDGLPRSNYVLASWEAAKEIIAAAANASVTPVVPVSPPRRTAAAPKED